MSQRLAMIVLGGLLGDASARQEPSASPAAPASSGVEVRLENPHRGIPRGVAVLLAGEHVVAVLSVVSLERGGQQIMDLRVAQRHRASLLGVELDRDRLIAAVDEHVPPVRMALDALVV